MNMKKLFRRLILLGAPAVLGLLEVWHPAHVYFDEMLTGLGDWWLLLHTLQMPLFPLIATALWLLLKDADSFPASLSRIALWIFAVAYTAFDTIAGIATGILARYVRGLNLTDGEVYDRMFELFLALFNLDMPGGAVIMNLAVWSWVAAAILAAVALYMKGYNRVGVILIGISALTFQSHAHPYGPITMALLLAGIICIEFFPYKWTEVKRPETGVISQ
ncbi:hypothetical protein [Paenibacillus alkalitolerans]|uniref:hypothetical protein n=1 Tax=Paenibacillus alkalitolerans TaxID=2799335 RepID=UPI0018F61089|nr:hypothetical protein [Paenibacillus alkalitolerans]